MNEQSDTVEIEDGDAVEQTPVKVKRGGRFTLFIAFLALFLTVIGIAAGYKNWLRISDKSKANKANIEVIQEELKSLPSGDVIATMQQEITEKTDNTLTKTNAALKEVKQIQTRSKEYMRSIELQVEEVTRIQGQVQQSTTPKGSREWVLAETEFLIQVANRQLHLAKSKLAAIAALKAADENLAKLGSTHYLPVRQQLSNDIALLEQFSEPDIVNITQKITAILMQLKPLSVHEDNLSEGKKVSLLGEQEQAEGSSNENEGQDAENGESAAPVEGNSLWSKLKKKAHVVVDDAITIRKHDKPLSFDLDAEARLHLYQLLQVRFETLRLLALQQYDKQYHDQITKLKTTITEYYPEAKADLLNKQLDELDKEKLQFDYPDISSSATQLISARKTDSTSKAGE